MLNIPQKNTQHDFRFIIMLCADRQADPYLSTCIYMYERYFHFIRLLFKGWYTSLSIKFMYLMVIKFFFSSITANAYEYFHFDAQ